MKKNALLVFSLLLFCAFQVKAQNVVKGRITDDSNQPVIGASVVIEGTLTGTITDSNGDFEFSTDKEFPLTIKVSYIGFSTETIIVESNDDINLSLTEEAQALDQVTVTAASRFEEKITESPVTIEKLGLGDIRSTPSFDVYSAIGNLKGVQSNTGSLTFTSLNTRGFADMQNFRFVQLLDDVYANAPGLGYPVGGNSGPADIDIASVELVPGANSALYGANAFNGILTINTKDPFYYQGLSAYYKTGVTVQDAGGTHPLNDFGFRYAKAFNNKFAFKINVGYLTGTDWTANDESYYISNDRVANADVLLATPRNDPNYDAVNVYGDEQVASVDLDGDGAPETRINRTGIKEEDIVDYDVQVFKADGAISYRFSDNVQATYGYRFIQSDAILRHTTIYPLVNFQQSFHRAEIKGLNWNVRAFHSVEEAGDSYAMLATGGFIEEGRRSSADWGVDYGQAYQGSIQGVAAGSHDAARAYADSFMPAVGSPEFNALRDNTLNNSDISTGGSKFIDNSTLTGVSADYDFTSFKDVVEVQVGANYRGYKLISEGQLFNDGPLGYNDDIPYQEYGAFVQAGKKLANEKLNLRASIRGDKHTEYDLVYTPRFSAVLSLDDEKKHNLRASYQTGFRNPSPQEGYIALDVGSAILLGGIEDNINNFSYEVTDPVSGQTSIVDGETIFNGLTSFDSFLAFAGTGFTDPTVLQPANIDFMKQEKNTTWEVGYKGIVDNRLLIDFSYYNTTYQDLIVRVNTFSPETGRVYAIYTNVDQDVTSNGLGLGLDYILGSGFRAGFNYTYTQFDADEAVENNPGFLPSFNTPENRINVSLTGSDVADTGIGFDLKLKYWDDYTWQSPFGQGDIESATVIDLALNYKITNLQSMVKLGASNLFGNEYRTVYGGPEVGSIFYVSWTYDQIFQR